MKYAFWLLLLYMGFTLANFLDLFSGDKWRVLLNAPAPSLVIIFTSIVAGWFLHRFSYSKNIEQMNLLEKMYKLKIDESDKKDKVEKGKKYYLTNELLELSKKIKQFMLEYDKQIEVLNRQHRTKEIKSSPEDRDKLWDEKRQLEVSFNEDKVNEYNAFFGNKAEMLRQEALIELGTDEPFSEMINTGIYKSPKNPISIKNIANELEKLAKELDKEK